MELKVNGIRREVKVVPIDELPVEGSISSDGRYKIEFVFSEGISEIQDNGDLYNVYFVGELDVEDYEKTLNDFEDGRKGDFILCIYYAVRLKETN